MITTDTSIMIAGAGVSGMGCARLLTELGFRAVVADDNDTARCRVTEAVGCPTLSIAEATSRLGDTDLLVTSPGWRPDSELLLAAAAAGVEVIGDIELAWRLDQSGRCGAPRTWIVVTGTNGKTTTTSMCAEMLVAGGHAAAAVGNIGVSIGDALLAEPRIDVLVAELSSFQLHWSSTLTPAAGVLLNLADDHIDWHGSFDAYAEAKLAALRGAQAIVNNDDPEVLERVPFVDAPARRIIGFGLGEPAVGDFGVCDGYIVDNTDGDAVRIAPTEGISPAGPAGVYDALAAAALARTQGVTAAAIAEALAGFEVSGHRGQIVHTHNGVSYIDNSKATNPHAADAALRGHDSIVWVAGGQLKGAETAELVRTHATHLKAVLLLGVDRDILAAHVREYAPHATLVCTDNTDPEGAMMELMRTAVDVAAPGDAVILAPAAASLDMYRGMGHRGECFARAAHELATP